MTLHNRDSEVRNMQHSSDMAYRVATALVECGIYPPKGSKLVGHSRDDYLKWAIASLEASHHEALVGTIKRIAVLLDVTNPDSAAHTRLRAKHEEACDLIKAILAKIGGAA